jgi:hypothetical protein
VPRIWSWRLLVAYITFGWIAGILYRFSTCRVYSTQLKTDNVYFFVKELRGRLSPLWWGVAG